MSGADVLEAAADYIEERGWAQHCWELPDGSRCAGGAIEAVSDTCSQEVGAYQAFSEWLFGENACTGAFVGWNNAEHRTAEQVCKEMRACAADLRAKVIPFICTYEDCDERPYAKGLCNTHYQRLARNGELQDDSAVLKLKAELALHKSTRPKNHDRAECAGCRLIAWLDGEGLYTADNLSHSRVPKNLA